MTLPAGKKPAQQAGRRDLLRRAGASLLGLCLLAACGTNGATAGLSTPPARAPLGPSTVRAPGEVELYSWFDLPSEDPRSRELSGIAWDEASRTLWAVQDATANLVPIVPDRDLRRWTFGPIIELKTSFPLDLEGVVVLPDGFIVASEKGPRVLEVDRRGRLRKDIALPEHFVKARENKSLESLTMSPDGRYLFTTSEQSLTCDGEPTSTAVGSRLRILRIARPSGEYEEHAYTTDALPHASGDYGVADLAAVSADELLVLERGWTQGSGNTARVYRVSLKDAATSCLASPSLAADAPTLAKQLVVDLTSLPTTGMPAAKQAQPSALLDNFEGMAVGPRLPDGRATIILVSDDNGRSDQVARILVLALP
ncbi:hypothetical protein BH11MYX4_BH11MYX4_24790 [soil metagenome]